MSTVVKDLGAVSAYAYAVEKGYTGTEAEFAELMASYAEVGQTATTAAQTATTKAGEAQTSAQTASSKASEASQSASQASGYAQTAETAKTDAQTAKTQADTARDEAAMAKAAAETAQSKAEDAQAAAESVAESIPSDYSQLSEDVSDLKEDLSDIQTATAEDVGKALKVKTVTDGKVTEWEFGEAGASVELDATLTDPDKAAQAKAVGDAVEKTVTAYEETEYTGNVVDPSNASVSGQWVSNLRMARLDGTFYSNPLVMGLGFASASPRDAEENNIPFVGSSATSVRIGDSNYIYKIEISGLTVMQTSYESLENLNSNVHKTKTTYTLSAIPDHWYISGKSVSGNVTSTNYGLTAEPSETYVAYAEPVINYGYRYADELDEHIGDVVNVELGGLTTATADDIGKTPKVKTVADGKVTAWDLSDENHFEPSCNLIDESKINWTPVGGYWTLEDGYYFPVTEGKKICSSVAKPLFYFYDADKTEISKYYPVLPYTLGDIPTGSTWARMIINTNANVQSDIQGKIMVYEVDSAVTSNDDRRDYVPPTKIIGNLVEGDIYDTAKPLSLDVDILTASAYKAVRALNHQRNAFRIATFNIYVTRAQYHWGALKQELKDHSIDICAMQEVSNSVNNGRYVQNFLTMNTWQFKYGSQAIFSGTASDKAVVSVYEIVSTELFTNSTGRTYAKTVINLPQYKRNAHQFTLSVYSAHLNLTASNRLTEASEILATVAQDTSDFIVICMDSNTFKSEADVQGKLPTWEAFISAGFTPIHYGEYSTITDMSDADQSLDQIFMGSNISCTDYDIVNSNDYLVPISGQNLPISDHCMVYADLQFDFDAVLESLNS